MKKKYNIIGLDYFLMKTDFFHKLSIRKLCKHGHGAQSAGILLTILCFLYQKGYYIKDTEELRQKIVHAVDGAFTLEDLQETILLSLEIGIFNKELYECDHVLTSKDIQECYLVSYPNRKKPEIKEYNLINIPQNEE